MKGADCDDDERKKLKRIRKRMGRERERGEESAGGARRNEGSGGARKTGERLRRRKRNDGPKR